MKIFDISTPLSKTEFAPLDTRPKLKRISSAENGDPCTETVLYSSLQCGTYIMSPSAFSEDGTGKTVDSYELSELEGPCEVIQAPGGPLTGAAAEHILPKFTDRVLIRSGEDFSMLKGTAEDISRAGYRLIGIEGRHFSSQQQDDIYIKSVLSGSGTLLLLGLDLSHVTPGSYFLSCAPVSIEGTEAAFCRAMLFVNEKR